MLVGSSIRRVAIIGGTRIPFARSMGVYAEASNQEMLTASLKGLVDRFNLWDPLESTCRHASLSIL